MRNIFEYSIPDQTVFDVFNPSKESCRNWTAFGEVLPLIFVFHSNRQKREAKKCAEEWRPDRRPSSALTSRKLCIRILFTFELSKFHASRSHIAHCPSPMRHAMGGFTFTMTWNWKQRISSQKKSQISLAQSHWPGVNGLINIYLVSRSCHRRHLAAKIVEKRFFVVKRC